MLCSYDQVLILRRYKNLIVSYMGLYSLVELWLYREHESIVTFCGFDRLLVLFGHLFGVLQYNRELLPTVGELVELIFHLVILLI